MAARGGDGCRQLLAALVLLALVAGPPPRAAEIVPVKVCDGQAEVVLSTDDPDDRYFLIVGSLARQAGPFPVTVQTEATTAPLSLPREQPTADAAWQKRIKEQAGRLARARQMRRPMAEFPPLASPPREKVFHLFVRDKDFHNPAAYAAVPAELWQLGQHCQVYVERGRPDDAHLRAAVADAVRTFDEGVYPRARERLGQALDVDRDGRFTILFTGWLTRMQNARVALGGFVRGSDFYRDLDPPFGNRCDMMYLSTALRAGPFLRTVLAHEYTHAVVFSEHVFGGYLHAGTGQDEESWLNEGLAHLVEDGHGYGWGNLDYRVSAFLSAPERYRLVVPDYYGSGVWRSPGLRGISYLFLRWCQDRHGPGLLTRLTQSSLHGVENLEVATQERFADLFRQWSAAVLLAGTGLEAEMPPRRPLNLRRPLGGRLLCGPRFGELALAGSRRQVELAGTGVAYLLLHSPGGTRSRVAIRAASEAALQVSLLRLPRDYPRLVVRWQAGRLQLTAQGGVLTLDEITWERLLAEGTPEDTDFRPAAEPSQSVRVLVDDPHLEAGQSRTTAPLVLPRSGRSELLIKVTATDEAGRRLAAWVLVPAG
jgi:hypothetical protein